MKIVVIVIKQLPTTSQMNLIVYPRSGWAGIPGRMSAEGKFDAYTLMKVLGSHGAHVGGSDVGQKSSPRHGDGKVYSLKVAKQILIQLPWPSTFFRIDPISRDFKYVLKTHILCQQQLFFLITRDTKK